MCHCPVGVWVIEQHAIILSTTVRSPTVVLDSQWTSDFNTNGLRIVINIQVWTTLEYINVVFGMSWKAVNLACIPGGGVLIM